MIAIASDHGGYELKERIKEFLSESGYEYKDFGTDTSDSCDYPDFAEAAGRCVGSGRCEKGVIVCTTGIGISISANKVRGVRAALCHDVDSAVMARKHNDANVLALGAKYTDEDVALEIVRAFVETGFEGEEKEGERHKRRVDKIRKIEEKYFR